MCCLAATSYGQLIRHFGGAITPVDYANLAATNHHLAIRFGHYGKREADADPQLVHHFNGAVTPFHAANYHATVQHLASKGYTHFYGKREAEAQLVHHINGAVTPYHHANAVATANHLATRGYYGYGHFYGKREAEADPQILTYAAIPYVYGVHPYLVAHPNGAVVPLEPADVSVMNNRWLQTNLSLQVVKARAEHLAAKAAA